MKSTLRRLLSFQNSKPLRLSGKNIVPVCLFSVLKSGCVGVWENVFVYRIPGIEPRVLGMEGKRSVVGLYSPASATNILVRLVICPMGKGTCHQSCRPDASPYRYPPPSEIRWQWSWQQYRPSRDIVPLPLASDHWNNGLWETGISSGNLMLRERESWRLVPVWAGTLKTVLTYSGGIGTRTLGQGWPGQDAARTASLHALLVFYFHLSLIETHSKEFGGGGGSTGSVNLVFSPRWQHRTHTSLCFSLLLGCLTGWGWGDEWHSPGSQGPRAKVWP